MKPIAHCKHCGTTEVDMFHCDDNGTIVNPTICIDCAVDIYESERPDREQRERERLDLAGYYDRKSV